MYRTALAAVAAAAAGSADAQMVLGVNNLASLVSGTAGDTLIQFDFSNPGAFVGPGLDLVTPTGAPLSGIGGLDFDAGGTLFASDAFGPNPGEIFRVDPATGISTSLGSVGAAINDLAWDPVTGDMYGVGGASGNELFANVDDPANAVSLGTFPAIAGGLDVGLAFDSQGNIHVHDLTNDAIYAGAGADTSVSLLHSLPFDSNFSQGLFVDWSRDDQGYHAALNGTTVSSENYFFGSLATGDPYGPFVGAFGIDAASGLPFVEVGDLTIVPIPAPAAFSLLTIAGLGATRRRG
ncbi:MAG: hypothetical protein AAGF47_04840 [Planctomycetota bacterium]